MLQLKYKLTSRPKGAEYCMIESYNINKSITPLVESDVFIAGVKLRILVNIVDLIASYNESSKI